MIGYLLAVAAQISYAVGAIILKKYLEKLPGLTLSLTSIGIAGFFSFGLLVLVTAGFLSLPALYLVKTNLKQIFSSENLLWVMVYAFFFVFLGEILLVIGYLKGKSLTILSLSTLLYPFFVALLSFFILKEGITLKIILGGVLTLIGYFLLVI